MADGKETSRSLAELRKRWPAAAVEKVEYWNYFAPRKGGGKGKRHDLFGFGDVLVAGPRPGFIIVQVTTKQQMSARRKKILGKPQAGDGNPQKHAEYRLACLTHWLNAGGRVLIQGWDQPNGPRTAWVMTEWEVTIEDVRST